MRSSKKNTTSAPESYLHRLQFDPKMLTGWIAAYLTNIRLVILLALTIALLGTLAYLQLPKRLNPEVKIPIVTIMTILPGAGPADVENLVTVPIEDELRSLKGIDTLASSSLENASVISIQFLSSVDRDKAKQDVQAAVDAVSTLPADAKTPKVTVLDFEDQPIWTFALVSTKDIPDLMRTAKELQERIEDLPKVDRVVTNGFDTQEIVIEVDPQHLADYGLNPFQLSELIRKARTSYPAGVVQTANNTFAVTIDPHVESIADIRALKLLIAGKVVSLADVATVVERSKPEQKISLVATPAETSQPAVTFSVYKTTSENIDAAGQDVKEVVEAFLEEKGPSYRLITLINTSDEIVEQFTDLLGEFRTTIILVMGVLLLFLGLRQSLISSLTVPLTFLSAFFFMQLTGMSINFLSLFSFLLSLGLLVDDTIVVVSAMTTYFKSKRFTPLETGLLVWKDTIIPIWSTTITTIWSFVPLLITSGIIGEFIKPIPVVVTVTMMSSTAIAVLITLPLMIVLLKPVLPTRVVVLLKVLLWVMVFAALVVFTAQSVLFPLVLVVFVVSSLVFIKIQKQLRRELPHLRDSLMRSRYFRRLSTKRAGDVFGRLVARGIIDVEPFAAWYKRAIMRILDNKGSRRRVMIAVVAYSVFCFALLPLGFVKNEFFPKSDTEQLFLQLKMSPGTTLEETRREAESILEQLRSTPETEFVTAEIGRAGSVGFSGGSQDASNFAFFSLRLTDHESRHLPSYTIAEHLRDAFTSYQKGKISVIEESGGPPAGADLQIKLLGPDLGELNTQADRIVAFLADKKELTNVNKSIQDGTSKLAFVPDQARMAELGVTPDQIGFGLRTFASGFTLDAMTLTEGSAEKTDIVLRLSSGVAAVEKLSQIQVMSNRGQSVPIASLGAFVPRVNPTSITRENFQRTISVSAAARPGASISDENKKLETFAKSMKLPKGYEWKTGGVNEENNESVQSILRAMILSAVLILITMVVQFGSFRQAVIVLIVIPLAVSSVFLLFALTGTPLSFPALIGVLSLFGIVVTNSMFIVDKINLNLKQGMPFTEAIADAGASRMEPIILTKLCTVFGLLPITIADPLWRGLGGAIISGLLLASTIMLLFIPVLYYTWMKPADHQR